MLFSFVSDRVSAFIAFLPFFLDAVFSITLFIANVIDMHKGKNGVNGPAQNATQNVAMIRHHSHLNIK